MNRIIALRIVPIAVLFSLLLGPVQTLAQEAASTPPPETPEGVTNCFDYYSFGSVQANITSATNSLSTNTPATFRVQIVNNNSYPIVDGALYVKVFKKNAAIETQKNINGPKVVDQFFALRNITLDAHATSTHTFEWNVPGYLASGDYRIATFFVSAEKFNLLGLSFTNDIVGNSFDFRLTSEFAKTVEFDHTRVTINDRPFYFAAPPPRIAATDSAVVSAPLVNNLTTQAVAKVTWNLYRWDGLREEALIASSSEYISLKPGERKTVSYVTGHHEFPVYYLVIESDYNGAKSILDTRFVRTGVDQTRINFPAVTSYPLKSGQETVLFSCLHNSGLADNVPDGTLVLTLKDTAGKTIHSYEYKGEVTGAMMGVKSTFTPRSTYANFDLTAELFNKGQSVDKVVMKYRCAEINPDACKSSPSVLVITLIVLGLIILFISIIMIKKRRAAASNLYIPVIIGLLFAGALLPGVTHAAFGPESLNTFVLPELYEYGTGVLPGTPNKWYKALQPNATGYVKYRAEIFNNTTQTLLTPVSTVSVGDQLTLRFVPHQYTDVYWVGTGYAADSPYGQWKTGAAADPLPGGKNGETGDRTAAICDINDLYWQGSLNGEPYDQFISLNVAPPTKTITNISIPGLTCGTPNSNGDVNCTVNSAGTYQPVFNFAQTYGKFYYSYYDYTVKTYYRFLITERSTGATDTYYATTRSPSYYYFNGTAIDTDYYNISYLGKYERNAGCYGNNTGMAEAGKLLTTTPYTLQVPAVQIDYTINAVVPNRPPTPPVITGPQSGNTNTPYDYGFTSTDPDSGDTLIYDVDWSSDGVIYILPGWGSAPSGSPVYGTKGWSTPNTYTIRARARDSSGATSAWSTYNVTISNPVATITGSCTANVSTAYQGHTITWLTNNIQGGNGSYTYVWSGTDNLTSNSSNARKMYSTTGSKTAQVTITSGGQTTTINCTGAVTIISLPTPTASTGNCGTTPTVSITITPTPIAGMSYQIYRGTATSPFRINITTTNVTDSSSLTAGASYTYRIKAYHPTIGESAFSSFSNSAVASSLCPPGVPTVTLTASPNPVPYNTPTQLTWTTGGNITSCTASGGWSGNKTTTGGTQTSQNITSTRTYQLQCTGPGGTSNPAQVIVTPALPTLSVTETTAACGGAVSFTWSNMAGGNSRARVYDYQNNKLLPPLATLTGTPWKYTQTGLTPGNEYSYYVVQYMDSIPATSSDAYIKVKASGSCNLQGTLTPNPPSGTSPLSSTLTAAVTGGNTSGPYSYQIKCDTAQSYPTSRSASNSRTCSYSSDGTYRPSAIIHNGTPGNSGYISTEVFATVTVGSGQSSNNLSASCTVTPTSVSIGQNVTWTAVASGGTAPYTYTWSGSPDTIDTLNPTSPSVGKSYNTTGTKTGQVKITDSTGTTATNACSNSVTVGNGGTPSNLSLTCSGTPTLTTIGNSVTWTAEATGAAGGVTYSWKYIPSNIAVTKIVNGVPVQVTGSSAEITYSSPGTKRIRITADDGVATAQCEAVVSVTDPSIEEF